ncbi:MAG: hypothetical protein J0H06_03250 [Actinobacteria bacterium]|nr:hypothetical protein [Actinomycetota bacterium]
MTPRPRHDFLDESTTTGRSVMSMSDVAAGDPNTDYALTILRHGAVAPRLEELVAGLRRRGLLDPVNLGGGLRPLIEEMLDDTSEEDWQIAALCLIEEEEEAAAADGPPALRVLPGDAEPRRAA